MVWSGQRNRRAARRKLSAQGAGRDLEARLRAAYADAGVTALAGASSPAPEAAAPTPVPATSSPASLPELNAAEIQMVAEGRMIYAVKTYKDRTGVDLKTAKAAIDAAREGSANS